MTSLGAVQSPTMQFPVVPMSEQAGEGGIGDRAGRIVLQGTIVLPSPQFPVCVDESATLLRRVNTVDTF